MIQFVEGNLLEASTEAVVNTVNCVGYMGKGIALQFKMAFPENFREYQKACKNQTIQPGQMFVYETGSWTGPKYIINFPTKRHWKANSKLEDIVGGLRDLVRIIHQLGIRSIAIPPLGCGLGGLKWLDVKPLIEEALSPLEKLDIRVYEPQAVPNVAQRPVNTRLPHLTRPRALLLALMDQYLLGDDDLVLLVAHKLAYFLQAAGEPLNLNFEQARYGPYAEKLNKVLEVLEGHFTQGYDGSRQPYGDLALLPGTAQAAKQFLAQEAVELGAYQRVNELIVGFDSPYGLELLSSVHWGMVSAQPPLKTLPEIEAYIAEWNERKSKIFKPAHIEVALNQLIRLGWVPPVVSEICV